MDEPTLELRINGEPFIASRYNTILYSFMGEQLIEGAVEDISKYDHSFLQTGENETSAVGAYVFNDHPAYADIKEFIEKFRFMQILNRPDVPQCDIDAWNNAHFSDLGDFVPDDWTPDGAV